MREIKLNHINKKLKLKTECDQEVIDQIEEYINENYERNTSEAFKKGVFGSPTFIYKTELFWGDDRLEAVSYTHLTLPTKA